MRKTILNLLIKAIPVLILILGTGSQPLPLEYRSIFLNVALGVAILLFFVCNSKMKKCGIDEEKRETFSLIVKSMAASIPILGILMPMPFETIEYRFIFFCVALGVAILLSFGFDKEKRETLSLIRKSMVVSIPILGIIALMPFIIMIIGFSLAFPKGPPMPTDAEMIEIFNSHEKIFEELHLMAKKDGLDGIPLTDFEKARGYILPISADRELEYDSLMKEIKVIRLDDNNLFVSYSKGDATWGIEKGFEYAYGRINDRKYTEKELRDAVYEKVVPRCEYYKKINEHWNLYIKYER